MELHDNVLLVKIAIAIFSSICGIFMLVATIIEFKKKNLKRITVIINLCISVLLICVGILVIPAHINDYHKKDYVYGESILIEYRRRNIFYECNFEGNHIKRLIFLRTEKPFTEGTKYQYYYGKRTREIVAIEEIK